jgi:hypothetical protein
MTIYAILKWLIPVFVGIAMYFDMRRRGLIRNEEATVESNATENEQEHDDAATSESNHVEVVQATKEKSTSRTRSSKSPALVSAIKPLAKKIDVVVKQDKPSITYDYEVRGKSVYIYHDGRSIKVMTLCLNATGKCGIEGEWLLMETRTNANSRPIWEARCIPRNGNVGGYSSERSIREAVRKKIKGARLTLTLL